MVVEGVVRRNLPIRVLRDNVVIYEGELESLRRFKEDVKVCFNKSKSLSILLFPLLFGPKITLIFLKSKLNSLNDLKFVT